MLDKMKAVTAFFRFSPKREGLLNDIVQREIASAKSTQKKVLLDICRTRWAERQEAYTHFYQAFVHVVRALEIIANGPGSVDDCDIIYVRGWDSHSTSDAQSLLTVLPALTS
jgi:hypothetical protein